MVPGDSTLPQSTVSWLLEQGADPVRVIDLSGLPPEQTQGFPRAIVFCLPVPRTFVAAFTNQLPDLEDGFLKTEQRSDELSERVAERLREYGYRAYGQSDKTLYELGLFDPETRSSRLPHKTLGRLAGIGFIGKNNLLVSEAYGCAFCLGTVPTDAPLATEHYPVLSSRCGACRACVDHCVPGALRGREWTIEGGRDAVLDAAKCCCALRCMMACPWTRRYALGVALEPQRTAAVDDMVLSRDEVGRG